MALLEGTAAASLGCCALGVTAQTSGSDSLRLTPSVSLTQTFTDNVRPGQGPAERSAVTQISAGLNLSGGSRKLQGNASYTLSELLYWGHPENNQRQQALGARLSSEFVEGHGNLEADANISRQAISPLNTQSPDTSLLNSNTTEVRSYHVSPSWRGQLAGLWSYNAKADYAHTTSGAGSELDATSQGVSMQLSRAQQGRLGYSLSATYDIQRHATTSDVRDYRLFATTSLDVPEADLKLSLNGGREHSNAATNNADTATTWGVGADWTPSDRTRLIASYDKRQFASNHSLSLQYRTARTVWNYTHSQQIAPTSTPYSLTFFDLYFALFASVQPDPVKRAQLVTVFLLLNGINPNSTAPGGFVSRVTTYTKSQTLSFAMNGRRSGITVAANRSDSSQLNPDLQVGGDLANGQHVIQSGLTANLSHRLTPDSSLNLTSSILISSGSLQAGGTRLRTVSLGWSGNPSRRTTVSAMVRRSDFDSPTNPYRENAAVATFTLRF